MISLPYSDSPQNPVSKLLAVLSRQYEWEDSDTGGEV